MVCYGSCAGAETRTDGASDAPLNVWSRREPKTFKQHVLWALAASSDRGAHDDEPSAISLHIEHIDAYTWNKYVRELLKVANGAGIKVDSEDGAAPWFDLVDPTLGGSSYKVAEAVKMATEENKGAAAAEPGRRFRPNRQSSNRDSHTPRNNAPLSQPTALL